jgi:hypothetical protein
MKFRLTFATLLVVGTLATSVCRTTQTDTAKLEELPKDIAATLQRVPNSDLLVSVAPVATKAPAVMKPTPPDKASTRGVTPLAVNCSLTTTYIIQVTYPITVCSPIGGLFSVLTAYDEAMSPGQKLPTNVKDYKLSSFQGKSLTASMFCRVRSGPWLGTIVKQRDCNLRESCSMSIGISSVPAFLWDGENCQSQNRPQEVSYIEPMFTTGVSSTPCSSKSTCQ